MRIEHKHKKVGDTTPWKKKFAFLPTTVNGASVSDSSHYTVWCECYLQWKVYCIGKRLTMFGLIVTAYWAVERKLESLNRSE